MDAAAWTEHRTAEGRVYYHNRQTQLTQWTKPAALKTAPELAYDEALANSPWSEYKDATSGRRYWHNKDSSATTWEEPEVLKRARDAATQRPSLATPGHAGPASAYPAPGYREREEPLYAERPGGDRFSHGFGERDRVSAPANAAPEPEYATHKEAEAAFMKALKRAGVQADWSFLQATRAAFRDVQFRALKHGKDREAAFKKYCVDVRTHEKEKERDRMIKIRADFTSMLQSHPEITHYTRWTSALPIVEKESIFRSAKDDRERRHLFEEYISKLRKTHSEKELQTHRAAMAELTRLFRDMAFEPYTRWASAKQRLQSAPRYAQDEKLRNLANVHILTEFERHIKGINERFQLERRRAKADRERRARQRRDDYAQLLRDLRSAGRLKAGTKWKDVEPLVADDPRYRAMLGQSGSTALDLFWDRLEEEEREIRNKRYVALDVLEDQRYEMAPTTTLDDFVGVMRADGRTASFDRESLALVFERILDKVLRRSEEEKDRTERQQRHLVDSLRSRIKHLTPPVGVGDAWEQVRLRLERFEEYRQLESDALRRAAFEKHVRRLKEREEEAASRRGPRDHHARDHPYEADRRKATADRELRYRQGSAGIPISPRMPGSPPFRHGDRNPRSLSGTQYERERRERDAERERYYGNRPDRMELDYGDPRPMPSRRRRPSRDTSPDPRRGSKRLRLDIASREHLSHARHDRTSRTPPAPTPPKEEPALRSGSEEGEIEEA